MNTTERSGLAKRLTNAAELVTEIREVRAILGLRLMCCSCNWKSSGLRLRATASPQGTIITGLIAMRSGRLM